MHRFLITIFLSVNTFNSCEAALTISNYYPADWDTSRAAHIGYFNGIGDPSNPNSLSSRSSGMPMGGLAGSPLTDQYVGFQGVTFSGLWFDNEMSSPAVTNLDPLGLNASVVSIQYAMPAGSMYVWLSSNATSLLVEALNNGNLVASHTFFDPSTLYLRVNDASIHAPVHNYTPMFDELRITADGGDRSVAINYFIYVPETSTSFYVVVSVATLLIGNRRR